MSSVVNALEPPGKRSLTCSWGRTNDVPTQPAQDMTSPLSSPGVSKQASLLRLYWAGKAADLSSQVENMTTSTKDKEALFPSTVQKTTSLQKSVEDQLRYSLIFFY